MGETVKNPPENSPGITSALFYDDPNAALEWLEKTFGLKLRMVINGPDGDMVMPEGMTSDG